MTLTPIPRAFTDSCVAFSVASSVSMRLSRCPTAGDAWGSTAGAQSAGAFIVIMSCSRTVKGRPPISTVCAARGRLQPMLVLQSTHQKQDEDDDKNDADNSTRAVAPATRVRPGGQCAHQHQDQDNQENRAEAHMRSHRWSRAS